MNKLKLNADKTDAILICSPRVKNNIDMPHSHIDLGNMTVPISNAAKNIGVLFDDALTMKNHVQYMCRVAYFHIHCIGKIRLFSRSKNHGNNGKRLRDFATRSWK